MLPGGRPELQTPPGARSPTSVIWRYRHSVELALPARGARTTSSEVSRCTDATFELLPHNGPRRGFGAEQGVTTQ